MADPSRFWRFVDDLVASSRLVVDRPRGSAHPRFPDMSYPLDYGYLEGTTSGDGQGIDVWVGASGARRATAVVCTVDGWKRDAEIKFLLGCTRAEIKTVVAFLNDGSMACTVIERDRPSEG